MQNDSTRYVVCVRNDDYASSLELRKIYSVVPDPDAESHGMIRLMDESGEDYLFPNEFFLPIEIPANVSHALAKVS